MTESRYAHDDQARREEELGNFLNAPTTKGEEDGSRSSNEAPDLATVVGRQTVSEAGPIHLGVRQEPASPTNAIQHPWYEATADERLTPSPIGELVKELVAIANADYAEDDPTTGEAYERSGRTIVTAADALEQLEQDKKYLIEKANRYANAKNEAQSTIAALRDENKRLREALEKYLDSDVSEYEAELYARAAITARSGE